MQFPTKEIWWTYCEVKLDTFFIWSIMMGVPNHLAGQFLKHWNEPETFVSTNTPQFRPERIQKNDSQLLTIHDFGG